MNSDNHNLQKIETIYKSNYRQIVSTLRYIADQIEKGDFGEVESAALVIRRKPEGGIVGSIEIFGLGEGGYDASITLLSQGLSRLLNETPHE